MEYLTVSVSLVEMGSRGKSGPHTGPQSGHDDGGGPLGRAATFRKRLLAWHDANQRDLPWRRTRDPYRILVSEIMLQQTRVAAVIPFYERFLRLFPDAGKLARARETTVLRAWAGLGYYSRARNLQAAAKQIVRDGFPKSYEGALTLPGVGPYTAAAVMSIACGQPHAAVDGNVRRVLSRLLADRRAGQTEADALLDSRRPGDFNQAMMELGAMICLAGGAKCNECPVSSYCRAKLLNQVDHFPARKAKRPQEEVRIRWAFVVERDEVLLDPPKTDGLWRGFWTLPEIELTESWLVARIRHAVTFRKIEIAVYTGQVLGTPVGLEAVPLARLKTLPLATPVRKFLALWLEG
jgi:A/G-specific adenine glycosylase